MRILQISSARHFGGGERHFVDLCSGLHRRGHELFVAIRPTNEWENRLDFIPRENVLHTSIRNSFGIFSANRIAAFIRDNDIDIVHAHVARDYVPANLACALSKTADFFLTRHVLFTLKPFNRFALRNLSKAIAVSSSVEAGLKKVFHPDQIVCIPNGVQLEHWSAHDNRRRAEEFRSLHNIPAEAAVIGTVGELNLLKGQRDFVLAAQEVARRLPNTYFVIVGKDHSPDQKYRRELRRLVRVFDLEDRFLWLDWLEDTAPVLAAMDVFVSASHTESFGLAILEAMASGTAVVATATDGATELLRDPELLVPISDPLALANKLCYMIENDNYRAETAATLQQRAADEFSLNRMVEQTEALYFSVRPHQADVAAIK